MSRAIVVLPPIDSSQFDSQIVRCICTSRDGTSSLDPRDSSRVSESQRGALLHFYLGASLTDNCRFPSRGADTEKCDDLLVIWRGVPKSIGFVPGRCLRSATRALTTSTGLHLSWMRLSFALYSTLPLGSDSRLTSACRRY